MKPNSPPLTGVHNARERSNCNTGAAINLDCDEPFEFEGVINKVVIDLK